MGVDRHAVVGKWVGINKKHRWGKSGVEVSSLEFGVGVGVGK